MFKTVWQNRREAIANLQGHSEFCVKLDPEDAGTATAGTNQIDPKRDTAFSKEPV
jgi:hypothetical protein